MDLLPGVSKLHRKECVKILAAFYCYCMLYTVEVMFPDASAMAEQITKEKINSPEWKKIIQSCLDF